MMAKANESMWPDEIVVSDDVGSAPVTHLRRQAALLGDHTHNIVQAEVETVSFGGEFISVLKLVAPCLDGVRYELLRVTHGVECYPVRVDVVGRSQAEVQTEDDFLKFLADVLASNKAKNAVAVLMEMSEGEEYLADGWRGEGKRPWSAQPLRGVAP